MSSLLLLLTLLSSHFLLISSLGNTCVFVYLCVRIRLFLLRWLTRQRCSLSGPPVCPAPASLFGWSGLPAHSSKTHTDIWDTHTYRNPPSPQSMNIPEGSPLRLTLTSTHTHRHTAPSCVRPNLWWVSHSNWPVNRCWSRLGGPDRGDERIWLQNKREAISSRLLCNNYSGSLCWRVGSKCLNLFAALCCWLMQRYSYLNYSEVRMCYLGRVLTNNSTVWSKCALNSRVALRVFVVRIQFQSLLHFFLEAFSTSGPGDYGSWQ